MFGFREARERRDLQSPLIIIDEHPDLRGIRLVPGSLTGQRPSPMHVYPRLGYDEDGAGAGLPGPRAQVLSINASGAPGAQPSTK